MGEVGLGVKSGKEEKKGWVVILVRQNKSKDSMDIMDIMDSGWMVLWRMKEERVVATGVKEMVVYLYVLFILTVCMAQANRLCRYLLDHCPYSLTMAGQSTVVVVKLGKND